VSEKISLFESYDTTLRDDSSQPTNALETSRHSKGSIVDRLAVFEYGDISQRDEPKRFVRNRRNSTGMAVNIRSSSGYGTSKGHSEPRPPRATSLSPTKTARFVKRGKVWEKVTVEGSEDQTTGSHSDRPLHSPRRKALPATIKPAFDMFESTHSSRSEQENRLYQLPFVNLSSPERKAEEQTTKRTDETCGPSSIPFSDLSASPQPRPVFKQKLEELNKLTREEESIMHRYMTQTARAQRRSSVGNGVTRGETVEEKMKAIDSIFNLHHEMKGTEVGTLKYMQDQIKEAHRIDFEKEVWEENRRRLLAQYEKKLVIERLQRQIARAKAEVAAMMESTVEGEDLTLLDVPKFESNSFKNFSESFQFDSGETITLLEVLSCSDFQYSDGGSSNALLLSQRLLSLCNDSDRSLEKVSRESSRPQECAVDAIVDCDISSKIMPHAAAPSSVNQERAGTKNPVYSYRYESDSDDDSDVQANRMKKVDKLLAKTSKYLGKNSSSAHSSPVRNSSPSRKVKSITAKTKKKKSGEVQRLSTGKSKKGIELRGEDLRAECRKIFDRDQTFSDEANENKRDSSDATNGTRQALNKISDAQSEARSLISGSHKRGRRASMSLVLAR
jgi:hypothetical protein